MTRFSRNSSQTMLGLTAFGWKCLFAILSASLILFFTLHKPHPKSPIETKQLPAHHTTAKVDDSSSISHIVKPGESLATIFHNNHIKAEVLLKILEEDKNAGNLTNISAGTKLTLQFDRNHNFQKLIIPQHLNHYILVTDIGGIYKTEYKERPMSTALRFAHGTINTSLNGAMRKAGLNPTQILQFSNVFADKLNLKRDLRKGDQFRVLYEGLYYHGKYMQAGNVVAAELITKHKTYKAVRYEDAKHHAEFYTPLGKSLEPRFLRFPLKFVYISSKFSRERYHPILHYARPHLGVDLAANKGTPVKAAGDGIIKFIGQEHGYGNVIIIQHGLRYSTLYGHLNNFAKHLHKYSHVKRGQLIAFVGETGLATGPHLHYEFRINGIHYDPVKVKLPNASPVPFHARAEFMERAHTLLAQMDLHSKRIT